MIRKLRILRSDFVGVYCRVSENYALMPGPVDPENEKLIEDLFGVRAIKLFVGNSPLVGALVAMDDNAMVVSRDYYPEDIESDLDLNIVTLRERINAMGNNIVMNSRAAIVHRDFSKGAVKKLADVLGIEVIRSTIGGIKTVGSVSVLTKKGMLVTPTISEDEQSFLSDLFGVQVKSGTANFGSIYVGTSVLANSKGIATGEATTSIELGRIDDTLS